MILIFTFYFFELTCVISVRANRYTGGENIGKLMKHMTAYEITLKIKAAKTLHNAGWSIGDIAGALELVESDVRDMINCKPT